MCLPAGGGETAHVPPTQLFQAQQWQLVAPSEETDGSAGELRLLEGPLIVSRLAPDSMRSEGVIPRPCRQRGGEGEGKIGTRIEQQREGGIRSRTSGSSRVLRPMWYTVYILVHPPQSLARPPTYAPACWCYPRPPTPRWFWRQPPTSLGWTR